RIFVANRVLMIADKLGFATIKPAGLLGTSEEIDMSLRNGPGKRSHFTTIARGALDTAIGVTAGLSILSAPNLHAAAERAAWLIGPRNRNLFLTERRPLLRDGPIGAAILSESELLRGGASTQLRRRAGITQVRDSSNRIERSVQLAARLPSVLWPEWALRFSALDKSARHSIGLVLTIATLVTGGPADVSEMSQLLGGYICAQTWRNRIRSLKTSTYWPSICAAVTRLRAFLETEPSRINYERRKSLDYSTLLPDAVWQDIREVDCAGEPGPRRVTLARHYLAEKISGSPTRTEDLSAHTGCPSNWLFGLRDFPLTVTAQLAARLNHEALAFLRDHDIDEPLTSAPPLDLI